ncbi:MAG TPA: MG2 domain-containing protein, partial [Bacteroidia bacterium]|nr:MG2 domain-containing protein [Bacteroidia bacterium]
MKNSGFKKSVLIAFLVLISIAGAYRIYAVQSTQRIKEAMELVKKPNTYSKDWQKVEALEKKGLYKSALELVDAIYKKAKAENNSPQLVKALLYHIKFNSQMEEESDEKAIADLRNELQTAQFPLKPLLHSILAQKYWDYYVANRWEFQKRTPLTKPTDDISTWDLKTIYAKTHEHYQLSLQDAEKSKQTPVDIYDEVLIKQKDTRKFRPTLFDFLANRAIDFYKNDESDLIKPAYKFELDNTSYFLPYTEFVKQTLFTKDTLSSAYYAIRLTQDLIRFHLEDVAAGKAEVLVNLDLNRLEMVKEKSTLENKDSLYINALENLEKQFANDPASAEINYNLALQYNNRGDLYNPKESEENKWMKKKAFDLCEAIIKKYPKSHGAQGAAALEEEIKLHLLKLNVDKVVSPDQPALALINYRNVKNVYARIIQSSDRKGGEDLNGDDLLEFYLKFPALKEWSLSLPDDGDYQTHATEIKIPELGVGNYVMLLSSSKEFTSKNNAVAYTPITLSGISYVYRQMPDGTYDFYMRHRETGAPLKNVSAQLFDIKYDYKTRASEYVPLEKYTSDESGFFKIGAANAHQRNLRIEFSYNGSTSTKNTKDFLRVENAIYQYLPPEEKKVKVPMTLFFLDRAIYRPGQTVYFKGIMLNKEGENHEVLPKTNVAVTLTDVNGQVVSTLNLVSNDYGTVNGSFTIPQGVLNGVMSISETNGGYISFSVEEYKRPKFEITFNPIKESYRLNEEVHVSGAAKSFSGASLSGATVKYRV